MSRTDVETSTHAHTWKLSHVDTHKCRKAYTFVGLFDPRGDEFGKDLHTRECLHGLGLSYPFTVGRGHNDCSRAPPVLHRGADHVIVPVESAIIKTRASRVLECATQFPPVWA